MKKSGAPLHLHFVKPPEFFGLALDRTLISVFDRCSVQKLKKRDEYMFNEVEISKIQRYLRNKFGNEQIKLERRNRADDSVEVHLDGEFMAVIYKDEEDGKISYDLNMAILGGDLPE